MVTYAPVARAVALVVLVVAVTVVVDAGAVAAVAPDSSCPEFRKSSHVSLTKEIPTRPLRP